MTDTSVNDRILFFRVFPTPHYLFFVNHDYLTDALESDDEMEVKPINSCDRTSNVHMQDLSDRVSERSIVL
ncbi:MAG: hypothetical protein PUP91_07010 [Rhizonema sp. PD37]|nr:hypothetical protein [Rhizonema sp. PD37]